MLAKKLDEAGVAYGLYDNAFTWIGDGVPAQRQADKFSRLNWPKLLGALARRFNPLLGDEPAGREYYWVVDQAEYATDVMFHEPAGLTNLYKRLVEHARISVSADDVLRFLGRKPNANFKGEVQSHVSRRVEGVRVVHRMKSNKLKMYDKGGLVLRIETTINNPREFRVRRRRAGARNWPGGICPRAWLGCGGTPTPADRRTAGIWRRWPWWTTTAWPVAWWTRRPNPPDWAVDAGAPCSR